MAKEDTNGRGGLEEEGARLSLIQGNLANYVTNICISIPCMNDQIIKKTQNMERVGNLVYYVNLHLHKYSLHKKIKS